MEHSYIESIYVSKQPRMDMEIFGSKSHQLCYLEKRWWSYKYLH